MNTGHINNKSKIAVNIEAVVSLDFNELKKHGVTIADEQRLTPFDREVHNAVATLREYGNNYINPKMIYNVLSGKSKTDMSAEARVNIMHSLDKMMSTLIEIDASTEYKFGRNKLGKYKDPVIPAERIETVQLNGNEVQDCILMFRNPPLFDYARGKNQG